VRAAWAPPNIQRQHAALLHFPRTSEIIRRFAESLRDAVRDPAVCEHNISVVLTDAPKFVEATFIMDPSVKIAHGLMQAW
jgi:hypothetical protein